MENKCTTPLGSHEVPMLKNIDDIKGVNGNRALKIKGNHSYWRTVLTVYGNEEKRNCREFEKRQQDVRLMRIKSATTLGNKYSIRDEKEGKLLPRRCNSAKPCVAYEIPSMIANRALELRAQHCTQMHLVNKYTALTRMNDYQMDIRANTPSHSARYPRFILSEKPQNDPEWGIEDYDVYVFHNKNDRQWVSRWIKNPLEAKRFNVRLRSMKKDSLMELCGQQKGGRGIIILTPDFIQNELKKLKDITCFSYILAIKLKQCSFPEELNLTSYIDLSFKDMTDITLQSRLLSKLVSSLQLPKSICS